MPNFRKPKDRNGFKIAIICALTRERNAVMEMFDEIWEATKYRKALEDPNTYRMGRVGLHNVVVAQLPGIGTREAASTAASLRSSFPNITLALVVGVCGGVPTETESGDILLGDIVLSKEIVDFTFGRQYDNHFRVKDTLADRFGRPNREIRGFLETMQGKRDRAKLKANSSIYLSELFQKAGFESYRFPGIDKDIVYPRTYRHKHQQSGSCANCATCNEAEDKLNEAVATGKSGEEVRRTEGGVKRAVVCAGSERMSCDELKCDPGKAVSRESRGRTYIKGTMIREPEIHVGIIGSGNSVMRSGYTRDELAEERRIIAFEMEAAGVWDNFPTVVIKAVSTYADSHNSRDWQDYAAASAAACMKAFLVEWPITDDISPDVADPNESIVRVPDPDELARALQSATMPLVSSLYKQKLTEILLSLVSGDGIGQGSNQHENDYALQD